MWYEKDYILETSQATLPTQVITVLRWFNLSGTSNDPADYGWRLAE
jgi:hypothetical protein